MDVRSHRLSLRRLLVTVLLTLFFSSALYAQRQSEECGCNAALAKDMVSTISTDKQQYAFLSIIDQATFEQYKRDVSLVATIPIAKALIEASADYSDFQQRRSRLYTQVGYSATREQEYRQLQVVTSPVAYPTSLKR